MPLSLVTSKRIRSGHKARVRRVINEANKLAGNYDPKTLSRVVQNLISTNPARNTEYEFSW